MKPNTYRQHKETKKKTFVRRDAYIRFHNPLNHNQQHIWKQDEFGISLELVTTMGGNRYDRGQ